MAYMKISNLYKDQDILLFKECYALEKIHGSSSHISHNNGQLKFFSGGAEHSRFVKLFDEDELIKRFGGVNATVYGEVYGAKIQRMSNTYGQDMRFVAFDVKVGDSWLNVPQAHDFTKSLDLEFVDYVQIPTDMCKINEQRDRPSVQAIRNGMGNDKMREGVVLRPLIELTKNNGKRIIAKHKRDEFRETKSRREISPEKLKVLEDANKVAEEWVTPQRISHVLDKIENPCMEKMKEIIDAMQKDIEIEGEGEIVFSPAVYKAIGKATATGIKQYFENQLS